MKFVLILSILMAVIFVNQISVSLATSEPVCGYTNSENKMIFLKYLSYMKSGQDYIDIGSDGKCLKRATCTESYKTQVEECSEFPVTCENKNDFQGIFPACCVKC